MLDLAKAHRNVTTEPPKCIDALNAPKSLEGPVECPNGKPGGAGTDTIQDVTPNTLKNRVSPSRNYTAKVPPDVLPNLAAPTPGIPRAPVPPAKPLMDKKGDGKAAVSQQVTLLPIFFLLHNLLISLVNGLYTIMPCVRSLLSI